MFSKLRTSTPPPAIEQRSIQLAGKSITYTLKRSSKRRSIGLRIDDRGLTVNMPLRASEKWLSTVLNEKADWVIEKLGNWQAKKIEKQLWQEGEKIAFRGEQLYLHVTDITNEVKIEKIVLKWYREEAER